MKLVSAIPNVAVKERPKSFRMLDLHAVLDFQTSGSVSYRLKRNMGHGETETPLGWLDVHHPCDGPAKTNMRVIVTQDYFDSVKMNDIVRTTLNALHIPLNERFEAEFVFQPCTTIPS